MRNPNNLNCIDYNNDDKVEILKIEHLPEYDIEDYDLFDQKDFSKYIKKIKDLVRHSFEYRQLVNYLRENLQLNKCSFYENVSNENNYKIKIEIHHEPFALEDIVLIVYKKRSYYREDISPEMVAKEILYLHYKFYIGLIPLSETVHELVHNNYLFIPCDRVLGDFEKFAEIYHEFLEVEQIETLDAIRKYTEAYNFVRPAVLDRKYIYIDNKSTDGPNLPSYQDIIDCMNIRIDMLKNTVTVENTDTKDLVRPIKYHKNEG